MCISPRKQDMLLTWIATVTYHFCTYTRTLQPERKKERRKERRKEGEEFVKPLSVVISRSMDFF